MPQVMKYYADSAELERLWTKWIDTKDDKTWKLLQEGIYKICQGVATQFNPQSEEEHSELSHETFTLTIDKIKDGRLMFKPGKAPVFNLLTTTIFRHLYSLKNKQNRRNKLLLTKYVLQSNIINKITDEKIDVVRNIISSKSGQFYDREFKLDYHDPKYIIDPIAFVENDFDYKLIGLQHKKLKTSNLTVHLLKAKSRVRRSIEINGDYKGFLNEFISVLKNKPKIYKFKFGNTSKGQPIEITSKIIKRLAHDEPYSFYNILFLPLKLLISVEESRIPGFMTFIDKFNNP